MPGQFTAEGPGSADHREQVLPASGRRDLAQADANPMSDRILGSIRTDMYWLETVH